MPSPPSSIQTPSTCIGIKTSQSYLHVHQSSPGHGQCHKNRSTTFIYQQQRQRVTAPNQTLAASIIQQIHRPAKFPISKIVLLSITPHYFHPSSQHGPTQSMQDTLTLGRHSPLSRSLSTLHDPKQRHWDTCMPDAPIYDPPKSPLLLRTLKTSSQRTNNVYTDCRAITGKIRLDQTGRFIVPSTSGNNYLFILYDSNLIQAEPILNRKKESIKAAYEKILCLLQRRGLHPQLH
jgi:hypothetical protein